MQGREQGIVKRFYPDRGFGFIGRTGDQDLFFHIHDVEPGDGVIREGGRVEFSLTLDQVGRQRASGVELV
jgi:cold shock CspA family protein